MANYCNYFIILFIGIILSANEGSSATSDLSSVRVKRDEGGVNIIQIFMKVEQLLDSCKKTGQTPSSNNTNPISKFIDTHDLQCLLKGFFKIVQEMFPKHNNSSRSKRDMSNILTDFIQLTTDIDKCKKTDQHASNNATNIVQKVLNEYDIGCLLKTLINFIKNIMKDMNNNKNNQTRSKRALQISDFTCFVMKLFQEESKITEIVKAYTHKARNSRPKRAAAMEQICNDFGATIDGLLKLILDFAPSNSKAQQS